MMGLFGNNKKTNKGDRQTAKNITPKESAEALYNKIVELYTQGSIDDAINRLEEAARLTKSATGETKEILKDLFMKGGLEKYQKENYAVALSQFLAAAFLGSNNAKYNVAIMAINGQGREKDLNEALEFAYEIKEDKPEMGNKLLKIIANEASRCGYTARKSGNYKQALEYLHIAESLSEPRSYYVLGVMYGNAEGVKANYGLAIEYMGKAAAAV